jgi:ribonuclease D
MKQTELVNLQHDSSIAALLVAAERIGVDTEFMREKTFFAELCLVQLSIGNRLICADPLGATDLSGFWSALMKCEWVVHSGRQDMEVVYQAAGSLPQRVYDTQIAAALLGYAPQIGYAGLVAELFGTELANRIRARTGRNARYRQRYSTMPPRMSSICCPRSTC